MLKIRSGIGYDIHRIEKGNGLFIGGVQVSNKLHFVAHSDGDILVHALIDSLLGSVGEKDIGELFPDSDERYKGINSSILLEKTAQILKEKQFEIINIDSVIIAETPKISPFKEKIQENIASILGIAKEDFNLKAKTREKMDAVGRGEAMECFCVSMVRSLT